MIGVAGRPDPEQTREVIPLQPYQSSRREDESKDDSVLSSDTSNLLRAASRPGVIFFLSYDDITKFGPREWEVIGLLCKGYGNSEIRVELGMTECALSKHLYNIRKKVGTGSTSGVLTELRRGGLVA